MAGNRATRSATLLAPLCSMSARVSVCTGSAPSLAMRLIEEPVISTRWIDSGADWAWAAACMPSARPPAQIRRTERDKTVSTIIFLAPKM
ncbi:hypothetical protein [Rugamonas sp. DEMB1]|uniref:hypothetical protein n=1 Tax=Rugamonas sp. DEMB1 TaxID=3039386 RepID=UPI00244D56DB|nr:hypothetical protein [Rugamonas sp. DEMB1]WGG53644.1 hypothetical protein QC826_23195 [Rugamonas sp. DEMB1]